MNKRCRFDELDVEEWNWVGAHAGSDIGDADEKSSGSMRDDASDVDDAVGGAHGAVHAPKSNRMVSLQQ